ncbi:MAG TPA: hypothetical protein VHJ20_15170 [Polyangia bacterium]|nr:hypothetical protein [Polyangia bacterium]
MSLDTLTQQLETIAQRIASVGLLRAASDLRKVVAELRNLQQLLTDREAVHEPPTGARPAV